MSDTDLFRDDDFDQTVVPDQFYYFEIMDRAHILCNHIDIAFHNHPGLDDEHSAMVAKANELFAEIYQWAGSKMGETI